MIITLIINILVGAVSVLFVFFPVVSLSSIPYIGTGVSTGLTTMVGVWYGFLETFPYAQLPWNIFLFVILPFEIGLILLKFFFGNRLPINVN